jgi:hypothetical protein
VFEVQSAAGVPDVVAAVFDQDVIAARTDTGFVTDPGGLAAPLALSDALARRRALQARQVAAAAQLHLSGAVSGPVGRVFGRDLDPSTGADPDEALAAANRRADRTFRPTAAWVRRARPRPEPSQRPGCPR